MFSTLCRFIGGGIKRSFFDLFRIGRIGINVFDGTKMWLWAHRKSLPIVLLGLFVFILGVYFGSIWLSKSSGGKKSSASLVGDSSAQLTGNPNGSLTGQDDVGALGGGDSSEDAADRGADDLPLQPAVDQGLAGDQSNASVGFMEEEDPEAALAGILKIGRRMVDGRQYSRANKILSQALEKHYDSSELVYLLVISQLANRDYADAGALLSDERFLDAEDPIWQVLYTSWLLYSPRTSHPSAAKKLTEAISLRVDDQTEVERIPGWFDARRGNYQRAVKVLSSVPASGERSFVDALFYSVALTQAGESGRALAFLTQAKEKLAVASDTAELESDSTMSLAVRTCKGTITRALVRYSAKLEAMAAKSGP